jgi:hypothetical protein
MKLSLRNKSWPHITVHTALIFPINLYLEKFLTKIFKECIVSLWVLYVPSSLNDSVIFTVPVKKYTKFVITWYDLRFSRRWLWRWLSSGLVNAYLPTRRYNPEDSHLLRHFLINFMVSRCNPHGEVLYSLAFGLQAIRETFQWTSWTGWPASYSWQHKAYSLHIMALGKWAYHVNCVSQPWAESDMKLNEERTLPGFPLQSSTCFLSLALSTAYLHFLSQYFTSQSTLTNKRPPFCCLPKMIKPYASATKTYAKEPFINLFFWFHQKCFARHNT